MIPVLLNGIRPFIHNQYFDPRQLFHQSGHRLSLQIISIIRPEAEISLQKNRAFIPVGTKARFLSRARRIRPTEKTLFYFRSNK